MDFLTLSGAKPSETPQKDTILVILPTLAHAFNTLNKQSIFLHCPLYANARVQLTPFLRQMTWTSLIIELANLSLYGHPQLQN